MVPSHLACLQAGLAANHALLRLPISQAMASAKERGKADTLGLDADPEAAIVSEILRRLDNVLILTEEKGQLLKGSPRLVVIVDPTDRSNLLHQFLKNHSAKPDYLESTTVGESVWSEGANEEWERNFGAPAIVTGAHTAITCVEEGVPTFSVILNYIAQSLIVASAEGIFQIAIPPESEISLEGVDGETLLAQAEAVSFPPLNCSAGQGGRERRYVTYLGKDDYRRHWQEWGQGDDPAYPCEAVPGPGRILYLSSLHPDPLGYFAANGEKISEWVHWLTFARFARDQDRGKPALTVYEVNMRARIYSGQPMASQKEESIFQPDAKGGMRMDFSQLAHLSNSGHYRATLVVVPTDNDWLGEIMKKQGRCLALA